MRLRRITPILLAMVGLTGGFAVGLQYGKSEKATRVTEDAGWTEVGGVRVGGVGAERGVRFGARTSFGAREVGDFRGELGAEESVLIAEIGALQMLAQGCNLALSAAEWTALAEVALDIQAIRQTYEAEIALVSAVAPGNYRVEIPEYAAAGAALRRKFYVTLDERLGNEVALRVVEALGSKLEGYFGGFGLSVQTLEVAGVRDADFAMAEITRTVTYSDDVEGGVRVTTRRETHFPGLEDPAGERWGVLLAVVAAAKS